MKASYSITNGRQILGKFSSLELAQSAAKRANLACTRLPGDIEFSACVRQSTFEDMLVTLR